MTRYGPASVACRADPSNVGGRDAVELGGHESHCRVDVVEESLVAGTETVHPG